MVQKRRTSELLFSMLFLCTFFSACVPSLRGPAVTPAPVPPPVPEDKLRMRIQALEELLRKGDALSPEKAEAARGLVGAYERILDMLAAPAPSGARDTTADILFAELGKLEGLTFRETPPPDVPDSRFSELLAEEQKIKDDYLAGNHEKVIEACMDLEKQYGKEVLDSEIGVLLAESLGETGRTRDALRVGAIVLPAMESRPGIVHLQQRMILWSLNQGDKETAQDHYQKLTDMVREVHRLQETARNKLAPLRTADPLPSPEPSGTDYGNLPGPLQDALRRAEALAGEGKFDEAKILLIKSRIRYPGEAEAAVIDDAMERLERSEGAHRSGESGGGGSQAEDPLEPVRRDIEKEAFETALEKLQQIAVKETDAPKAAVLRDQAISGIIQMEREKAARDFLKARSTNSRDEKQELLISSYRILKNLIERFPQSPLASKLRDNLNTVRLEMENMGMQPSRYIK